MQYSDPIGWGDVSGTLHTGHRIELGRIEKRRLTVQDLAKFRTGVFTPTPPAIDYESDGELYAAMVDFLMTHVDLPSPTYFSICALFAGNLES